MRRPERSPRGYAWFVALVVLAVAVMAGVTSAQEPAAPAPPAPSAPPEIQEAATEVADAADEIGGVEPGPADPAPTQPDTPPQPPAEQPAQPAPEAAQTAPEAPAQGTQPAPEATTPAAPAPASGQPAAGLTKDPTPTSSAAADTPAAAETPADADATPKDTPTGTAGAVLDEVEAAGGTTFEDNPCRTAPKSDECARFLYPNLCEDPSVRTCELVASTNPCTAEPEGQLCQNFLEAACRNEHNSSRCFTIRIIGLVGDDPPPSYQGRFQGQKNPCRANANSDDCRAWLSEVGVEWCRYTGLDRQSCIALLVAFQLPSETVDEDNPGVLDCLRIRRDFPAAQPPPGSVCEYYLATEFDGCSRDVPPILCIVRFGGSAERLGIEDADSGGDDAGRGGGTEGGGSKPLIGGSDGGGDRDELVPDPGDSDASEPLAGDADDGRRGRRSRARRNLPRTGADLEHALLAGFVLLVAGGAARRLTPTPRRTGT